MGSELILEHMVLHRVTFQNTKRYPHYNFAMAIEIPEIKNNTIPRIFKKFTDNEFSYEFLVQLDIGLQIHNESTKTFLGVGVVPFL